MSGAAAADVTGSTSPTWPIAKAEAAIEALVGKHFFRDNFVFASDLSTFDPGLPDCANCTEFVRTPHHNLEWRFRVANRPFVDTLVLVVVSPDGEVLYAPDGVPNCIETPSLCRFPIDEADALRIARENDLETGTKPWTTSFHCFAALSRRSCRSRTFWVKLAARTNSAFASS